MTTLEIVDFAFYFDEYRRGVSGGIPEDRFALYADSAYREINARNIDIAPEQVIPNLQILICESAEIIYTEQINAVKAKEIASESNMGTSVTIHIPKPKEPKEITREIRELTAARLRGTPLFKLYVIPGIM